MRHTKPIGSAVAVLACAMTVAVAIISPAEAQGGPSLRVTYDFLPYQDIDDPIVESVNGTDTTYFDNPQVQLRKLSASLSLPITIVKDRTVLINDFSYQLIEFEYRRISTPLERLHAASYTLMLQHRFSQRWSVWALGTPSLASDLGAEVSEDDFNFQTAAIAIHHFSSRFSLGVGAAYTTQFGSGEVVPVLAFDWNNGKNLMARAILPSNLEIWYRPSARLDLGLVMSGDGNNFRGDPEVYQVIDPQLRYTMLTVGPAARIHLAGPARLRIEAGVIGLHRFEFFDGDREASSYDLEPAEYARIGLEIGG